MRRRATRWQTKHAWQPAHRESGVLVANERTNFGRCWHQQQRRATRRDKRGRFFGPRHERGPTKPNFCRCWHPSDAMLHPLAHLPGGGLNKGGNPRPTPRHERGVAPSLADAGTHAPPCCTRWQAKAEGGMNREANLRQNTELVSNEVGKTAPTLADAGTSSASHQQHGWRTCPAVASQRKAALQRMESSLPASQAAKNWHAFCFDF